MLQEMRISLCPEGGGPLQAWSHPLPCSTPIAGTTLCQPRLARAQLLVHTPMSKATETETRALEGPVPTGGRGPKKGCLVPEGPARKGGLCCLWPPW